MYAFFPLAASEHSATHFSKAVSQSIFLALQFFFQTSFIHYCDKKVATGRNL